MDVKALSKKQKAAGLKKLRFYCQICQKQCGDENGFKSHLASENHLRQIQIFSQNSSSIIDDFSKDFRDGYLQILSQRHSRTKIDANKVYQEYIANKHHVHMNSTIWTTFSEFVKMLGRESYCRVEETAHGWDIEYIDRDPKIMARAEEDKKRKRVEVDEEERRNRQIAAQVAAAAALMTNSDKVHKETDQSLQRHENSEETGKISLSIAAPVSIGTKKKKPNPLVAAFNKEDDSTAGTMDKDRNKGASGTSQISALIHEEASKKQARLTADEKRNRKENWLHVGIQVKIINKDLGGGKFYKRKGAVVAVVNDFAADILVDDAKVRLDQQDLETVIPKVGGTVLVVNGRCRGSRASLEELKVESYCCSIKILEGPFQGLKIDSVELEDVSKLSK